MALMDSDEFYETIATFFKANWLREQLWLLLTQNGRLAEKTKILFPDGKDTLIDEKWLTSISDKLEDAKLRCLRIPYAAIQVARTRMINVLEQSRGYKVVRLAPVLKELELSVVSVLQTASELAEELSGFVCYTFGVGDCSSISSSIAHGNARRARDGVEELLERINLTGATELLEQSRWPANASAESSGRSSGTKRSGRPRQSDPTADENLCREWKKSNLTQIEFETKERLEIGEVRAAKSRLRAARSRARAARSNGAPGTRTAH